MNTQPPQPPPPQPQVVKIEQEEPTQQKTQGQTHNIEGEASSSSQRGKMSTKEKYRVLKRKYGELLQECATLGEEMFKARRYIAKLEKERK